MKEFFVTRNFGADSLAILEKINSILERYEAEGLDLNLRQLYYQLVKGDLIPHERSYKKVNGKWIRCPISQGGSTNAEPNYKWIGDVVSDARLAGLIDWDMISDRGRITIRNPHWTSPQEIVESCANQFRIDKWETQPCHVELMIEKQALEGVLEPICRELDVALSANKGYSSSSALYGAAKRMKEALRNDKEVHLIYLGDHDPSGIDMTRDVAERLNLFANVIDGDMFTSGNFDLDNCEGIKVHRIALNMDQVEALHPPENPTKLTDSRATSYIRKFGESCWELDAIEPRALAALVRREVSEIRDANLWAAAVKKEKDMRDELIQFAREKGGNK